MKFGINKKNKQTTAAADVKNTEDSKQTDLSKLKKKELLEIMLRQGEEIDTLRARVAELEAQLSKKEFDLSQIGSIAEASLVVTNVFEEAQKAAIIYLNNVKRAAGMVAEKSSDSAAENAEGGGDE